MDQQNNAAIDEKWMTTNEAAAYLGYSSYTMRRARLDGTLGGKEQPKFTRAAGGKAIRYKKSDLDKWMAQESQEV